MGGSSKKKPLEYTNRWYRGLEETGRLVASKVEVQETDLYILADRDVTSRANDLVVQYRLQMESYIDRKPVFASSLAPVEYDPLAPTIIKDMVNAGATASVGPMAAVAGAMSEYVGKKLLEEGCREIIVENGGDVFIHRTQDIKVAIYAGDSPLSNKVGLYIKKENLPLGVCTSSGKIGHSLSFGLADSVTVLSKSTPLADAVATRLGNEIESFDNRSNSIEKALGIAQTINGIDGVVIICDELMGAWGDVTLIKLSDDD